MIRYLSLLLAACVAMVSLPALAQMGPTPVGRCFVPPINQSWTIYSNFWVVQDGNPANSGPAMRDPSGMTFLRLPSRTPMYDGYFVDWNGALVQVIWGRGAQQIGRCNMAVPAPVPTYFPSQNPDYGVQTPIGLAAIPGPIVNSAAPYGLPLIASPSDAQNCAREAGEFGPDSSGFNNCMVHAMLGPRESGVYDCAAGGGDAAQMAACTVGALGGQKERQIAGQFNDCYGRANGSYQSFSLCMASQNFDPDTARLIQCISRQGPASEVAVLSAAVCYGQDKLGLNTESQILIQCAVASGGEPEAFAVCAGGELTARELDKCRTGRIGTADGCFGPNNDIVKYLKGFGLKLAEIYGPLNPLVRRWNDGVDMVVNGASREGAKVLSNVVNETTRGAQNIRDEVSRVATKVMPRITVGKPKGKIFGKKFSL